MAIVEDEVRNESGEENEIEVVVEEDDGEEQDSADEDSDDDGSDDEEMLETKVAMLEQRVTENPYNYDDHIELIQALWRSSELDRWREAFTRLQKMSLVSSEHWVMRLQTESSLAHSQADVEKIADLFQQALLDCFTLSVLTEWCTWALHLSDIEFSRKQLEEIVKRAGADPLSGKIFWDAKKEFETTQLETMSEDEPGYKEQEARILYCVEEVVSRPLLHHDESWAEFEEWAIKVKDKEYIEKVKLQHEAAADFLEKITRFEDKLLTLVDPEEKCDEFQEYISTVKQLAEDTEKYGECDINGILKVLYERATTDCLTTERCYDLCEEFIEHVREHSSRATYQRAVEACTRRQPHVHKFWMWAMRQAEKDGKEFDEIKSILETALSRGMKSFKEADFLWMSYLESVRRHTNFEDPSSVDRLRRTFRLAWDSLAEAWGADADESFVPIYWARVEYTRVRDHVRGREVFEEAIKYGNNRTICKYWEMLIHLEMARQPPPSINKMRDVYKRALLSVQDYLPTICTLWTFWERDVGTLDSTIECYELCEKKLKEWQEKMEAQKKNYQRNKGKQNMPKKKSKFDKKQKNQGETKQSAVVNKGKRKLTSAEQPIDYKKRKEADNEMDTDSGDDNKSNKLKRTRTDSENNDDATDKKRKRREESLDSDTGPAPTGRDACTLFISNLDFHVNEKHLREKLSEYGEIVSLRIKTGIKSFGGSICYCQYKNADSVEEALKHDRSPLDGRPMFLSRYNAKKTKQGFKYSTEPEKNKLFVKNLPFGSCTKEKLTKVFEQYGKLKDVRVVTYKDGKPKGLAYVDYEDEESAATALKKTNGLLLEDRKIEVAYSAPPPRAAPGPAPTLGQPKRETGGMRRTQISSLIPRVLQTPAGPGTSTSTPSANGSANGQKQLSNSDFRDMLLKK